MRLDRVALLREEEAVVIAALQRLKQIRQPPESPNQPWLIPIGEIVDQIGTKGFNDRIVGRRLQKMKFSKRKLENRTWVMFSQTADLVDEIIWDKSNGVIWAATVPIALWVEAEEILQTRWDRIQASRRAGLETEPKTLIVPALLQELMRLPEGEERTKQMTKLRWTEEEVAIAMARTPEEWVTYLANATKMY